MHQHDGSGEDSAVGEEMPLVTSSWIPEEIVEMIIARMPFPSVCKAQFLSRSWKCEGLTPFQKEVNSMSHKWPSYCPVFVSGKRFQGFDRLSWQWKNMYMFPLLSIFRSDTMAYYSSYSCAGSLMLVSTPVKKPWGIENNTFVINEFMGNWTQLHLERIQKKKPLVSRLLPGDSSTTYRVLQIHSIWNRNLGSCELQTIIYDSKVGSSSSVTNSAHLPVFARADLYPLHPFHRNEVYLHGKLYWLCKGSYSTSDMLLLCVNHVDSDKTWTATGLSFSRDIGDCIIRDGGVLLCGERVFVVIHTSDDVVFIYELELEALGSLKPLVKKHRIVSQVPPGEPSFGQSIQLASDDDFIYVGVSEGTFSNAVMMYNVHSGKRGTPPPPDCSKTCFLEDGHVTMLGSAFTPGLNPLAKVGQSDIYPEFST